MSCQGGEPDGSTRLNSARLTRIVLRRHRSNVKAQTPHERGKRAGGICTYRFSCCVLFAVICMIASGTLYHRHGSRSRPERTPWPDFHPHANDYFTPGKIWDHNDEITAKLERCAALGILRNTSIPLPRLSDDEEAVLIAQGCGTNETTVIVLLDEWFVGAYEARSTSGEVIYAQSVISTLNALGYSYMFASLGWGNYDLMRLMQIWEKHRWNVRLVLGERNHVKACWENRGRNCVRTHEFPEGIDPWRLMSFWYWDEWVHCSSITSRKWRDALTLWP